MEIGFDIISDLYLEPEESFNWENKATSLYCVIAGNISNDSRVIISTLNHLARFYQGVFYIPGQLEFENSEDIDKRYRELSNYCKKIRNVAFLNHHVDVLLCETTALGQQTRPALKGIASPSWLNWEGRIALPSTILGYLYPCHP